MARTLLFLVVSVWVVSGCDSDAGDDAPVCGTLQTRVDTVYAQVGETIVVDLSEEASQPDLTYTLLQPVAGVEVQGRARIRITPTSLERTQVVMSGRAACGEVERVRVIIKALPDGVSCRREPQGRTLDLVRLAAGGAEHVVPLWGRNGLFDGHFDSESMFNVTGPDGVTTSIQRSDPTSPASLMIAGTHVSGGPLTVVATDVCNRTVMADLNVEVVDSPVCEVIDPSWVDYLPLAVGDSMRFSVSATGSGGYVETWTIVSSTECVNGERVYDVGIENPGGWRASRFLVDRNRVSMPAGFPVYRFLPSGSSGHHGNFLSETWIEPGQGITRISVVYMSGHTILSSKRWDRID